MMEAPVQVLCECCYYLDDDDECEDRAVFSGSQISLHNPNAAQKPSLRRVNYKDPLMKLDDDASIKPKTPLKAHDWLSNKGQLCKLGSHEFCKSCLSETQKEQCPVYKKILKRYPQDPLVQAVSKVSPHEGRVYQMDSGSRGICLIISNKNFGGSGDRRGTERDVESMSRVFSWLGFRVLLCVDKTAQQMEEVLEHISKLESISKVQLQELLGRRSKRKLQIQDQLEKLKIREQLENISKLKLEIQELLERRSKRKLELQEQLEKLEIREQLESISKLKLELQELLERRSKRKLQIQDQLEKLEIREQLERRSKLKLELQELLERRSKLKLQIQEELEKLKLQRELEELKLQEELEHISNLWYPYPLQCGLYEYTASGDFIPLKELPQHGDAFICCLMSHGGERGVCGVDNKELPIAQILSPFNSVNCPALNNKPKAFFIQACRGGGEMWGIEGEDAVLEEIWVEQKNSTPSEADFLVFRSTVQKYVSYRNAKLGSTFIQTLCSQLISDCPRGEDILTILTEVNNKVSRKGGYCKKIYSNGTEKTSPNKQVSEGTFTLRKRLVFPVQQRTQEEGCRIL